MKSKNYIYFTCSELTGPHLSCSLSDTVSTTSISILNKENIFNSKKRFSKHTVELLIITTDGESVTIFVKPNEHV